MSDLPARLASALEGRYRLERSRMQVDRGGEGGGGEFPALLPSGGHAPGRKQASEGHRARDHGLFGEPPGI